MGLTTQTGRSRSGYAEYNTGGDYIEGGFVNQILLLHGPNLNLLGKREPVHYGHQTLAAIDQHLTEVAGTKGYSVSSLQSNAEHILIDRIHSASSDGTGFIIINPAALTHTSIAIRDALTAVAIPFIEVHLSNVHAREPFRRHSYFSDRAMGVIAGFGGQSYELALQAAMDYLATRKQDQSES